MTTTNKAHEHIAYRYVDMIETAEVDECDDCQELADILNEAMEKLDEHLMSLGLAVD